MAVQGLNALQLNKATSFAGLVTENNLYAIQQREPQLASEIITQINSQMGNIGINSFINKYPIKMMPTDAPYRWKLKGDDKRAIQIVSFTSSAYSAVGKAGLNQEIFQVELAENIYDVTDYLVLDDREYGFTIVGAGYANGTNWVYEVQTMNPVLGAFIPSELLQAGKKVSRTNNAVTNTLNDQYVTAEFTSHFDMENIFSTSSIKQEVPGNLAGKNGALLVGVPVDGQIKTFWTEWQDFVTESQYESHIANRLMFDQINQKSDGTFANKARNGFPIKQGAGLRQQISPSHKFYYTTLSLDYLNEVAVNLSINKLKEDQREFLILTGERGMYMFSDMIANKVAVFNPTGDDRRLKVGSGIDNLGFGGQYRTFMGYNGIKFTVMHMPEYDDVVDNRWQHPDGGNVESYRMTIMNIGTTNGEPNIQRLGVTGRDKSWYEAGSCDPLDPANSKLRSGSSGVDGYVKYKLKTFGLKLTNPLSAAELIPNVPY